MINAFPGFYGSIFDSSETAYNEIIETVDYYKNELDKEVTEDDFDFDYKGYEESVAIAFTDVFADMYDLPIIKSMKYSHIWSPKYYNFENDELYAEFEFTDDWKTYVRSFIEENKNWLSDIIEEKWKSRDGFISFMSTDINDWTHNILDVEEDDIDGRYLGEMLTYMFMNKYNTSVKEMRDNITEEVFDEIYPYEYVFEVAKSKE